MKSIDEFIQEAREQSKYHRDKKNNLLRTEENLQQHILLAEEQEQLVQYLEELKKYQENNKKIIECIHSSNRGSCDYFIVDQIEELMEGIGYDE